MIRARSMRMTKIENYPADKVEDAREALAKAHARLVRAALKAGQSVPEAPALVVVATRFRSRCRVCKMTVEGFAPASHRCFAAHTSNDSWTTVELVGLEIHAERPALAGWEFLACVEPLDGGNLIRQVPGAAVVEGELTRWRDRAIGCDHCRAARWRKETFILRADGSDPAIPAGTYKQVGRNCISVFLGGKSARSIVAALGWSDVVRGAAGDEDEGEGWFGRARVVHAPLTFLTWVACSIREDGWVSRATARAAADQGASRQATADHALYLLSEPFGGGAALERWREDRERCAPTDAERGRAAAALEWARTLAPTSDYECNLALVARQAALDPKHAGILASAVAALNRALGHEMERRRREAENAANPSRHVGEIDQRIGLDLLVERVVETATEFGALNIIIARDARNNLFVWRTGAIGAEPGERLRLRATVKKHTEFRGQVQTELTRGSVLERITGPASTFKATPSAPPSDKPAKARKAKRPRAQADSVMAA